MAKFTWQDGTLVSKAKVEIGGTIYEVDPEEYSGATPLSASNLNAMQDGIYKDIDNKQLAPDILYSNSVGTTGDITLSKNADNYSYKEIFFAKDGNENSVKISGNKASLIAHYTNSVNNTTYINFKNITISGTSLTVDSYQEWHNIWGSSNVIAGNTNGISIIKVLGYK